MNEFSYYNIFASKGVEYLITIGFFSLLIPFWFFLKWRKNQIEKRRIGELLIAGGMKLPGGIYFSKNHTWTHLTKKGTAMVGIDDFVQHLTGEVKVIHLKGDGDHITKGEEMAILDTGERKITIYSPVTGTIKKVNDELSELPGTSEMDPYADGWFYGITPENWKEDTSSYYLSKETDEWIGGEMSRVRDFLSSSLADQMGGESSLVLQDGGYPSEGVLRNMSSNTWNDFQKQFLEE